MKNKLYQYDLDKSGNHMTEQGTTIVEVYIKDKLSGEICGIKWIKRAELARYFDKKMIVGSQNNKFIVEL